MDQQRGYSNRRRSKHFYGNGQHYENWQNSGNGRNPRNRTFHQQEESSFSVQNNPNHSLPWFPPTAQPPDNRLQRVFQPTAPLMAPPQMSHYPVQYVPQCPIQQVSQVPMQYVMAPQQQQYWQGGQEGTSHLGHPGNGQQMNNGHYQYASMHTAQGPGPSAIFHTMAPVFWQQPQTVSRQPSRPRSRSSSYHSPDSISTRCLNRLNTLNEELNEAKRDASRLRMDLTAMTDMRQLMTQERDYYRNKYIQGCEKNGDRTLMFLERDDEKDKRLISAASRENTEHISPTLNENVIPEDDLVTDKVDEESAPASETQSTQASPPQTTTVASVPEYEIIEVVNSKCSGDENGQLHNITDPNFEKQIRLENSEGASEKTMRACYSDILNAGLMKTKPQIIKEVHPQPDTHSFSFSEGTKELDSSNISLNKSSSRQLEDGFQLPKKSKVAKNPPLAPRPIITKSPRPSDSGMESRSKSALSETQEQSHSDEESQENLKRMTSKPRVVETPKKEKSKTPKKERKSVLKLQTSKKCLDPDAKPTPSAPSPTSSETVVQKSNCVDAATPKSQEVLSTPKNKKNKKKAKAKSSGRDRKDDREEKSDPTPHASLVQSPTLDQVEHSGNVKEGGSDYGVLRSTPSKAASGPASSLLHTTPRITRTSHTMVFAINTPTSSNGGRRGLERRREFDLVPTLHSLDDVTKLLSRFK